MRTVKAKGIKGSVDAPPSKSAMIRAVAASFLADGTSVVVQPSFCNDARAALNIIGTLGCRWTQSAQGVIIEGTDGMRRTEIRKRIIDCGESGLSMRMFAPILVLREEEFIIQAEGSLRSRPVGMVEILRSLGAQCRTDSGFPPVTVRGRMRGGEIEVEASESSQFLTGVLMALPLCEEASTVRVVNLKSRPYVEMTLQTLRSFGIAINHDRGLREFRMEGGQRYVPCDHTIEGDWSGAAFLLVAGAIGGSIQVRRLAPASFQADRAIMDVLAMSGAKVQVREENGSAIAASVNVERDELRAFNFDASQCPDLVPPLVALAAHCEGKSTIHGAGRLRHKESDRATTLCVEFSRLGVEVVCSGDELEVTGGGLKGGIVDSHGDHRIAMACAVASIGSRAGATIINSGCVAKSYPSFFEDIQKVEVR